MPDLALRNGAGSSTLLGNWTDGRHLAVGLPSANDESHETAVLRESLRTATVIELPATALDDDGRRQLGEETSY